MEEEILLQRYKSVVKQYGFYMVLHSFTVFKDFWYHDWVMKSNILLFRFEVAVLLSGSMCVRELFQTASSCCFVAAFFPSEVQSDCKHCCKPFMCLKFCGGLRRFARFTRLVICL